MALLVNPNEANVDASIISALTEALHTPSLNGNVFLRGSEKKHIK